MESQDSTSVHQDGLNNNRGRATALVYGAAHSVVSLADCGLASWGLSLTGGHRVAVVMTEGTSPSLA